MTEAKLNYILIGNFILYFFLSQGKYRLAKEKDLQK